MPVHSLDDILYALDQHQQRATYAAVAALVDRTPRLLMHGRPRTPSNSWIVAKSTGRPTGYKDEDIHPDLLAKDQVLATREELSAWLARVN